MIVPQAAGVPPRFPSASGSHLPSSIRLAPRFLFPDSAVGVC
ncbi:hypothetical protein Taro_021565 [Colocasia esculenta]|uniref:Uncharacterized protein n=1 Tax=Colocasia esculenta TaxID=4460 RepID=A0A843VBW7_COLES|nr:hypothetical protein [Colocasia esculenta]